MYSLNESLPILVTIALLLPNLAAAIATFVGLPPIDIVKVLTFSKPTFDSFA